MHMTRTLLLAAAATLALSASASAQFRAGQPGTLGTDGLRTPIPKADNVDLSKATVADGFSFFAAGDLLGPHQAVMGLNDPEFAKVAKIIQSADVAFANHEGSAFDLNTFAGTHAPQNGGGYPRFEPALDRDFKAMGLDIVSMANNHAGDWGAEGLIATMRMVTEAGLIEAGAGGSLSQARAPGIFETPKGRVALIATASTYNPGTPAADGEGALKPRPGISTLRTTAANVVTAAEMAVLRPIAAARSRGVTPDATTIRLGGNTFAGGNSGGTTYTDSSQLGGGVTTYVVGDGPRLTYTANPEDQKAILASITTAKKTNDFVVFSIHAHENAGLADTAVPADFLPTLFHAAIDAGADVVVRHGPHELNGIEIYKGKPIFYALGSLFYGVGGPDRLYNGAPQPAKSYDSAMAVTDYKAGKPVLVRVYPLATNTANPKTFSAPVIATGAEGQRILEKIRKDSEMFHTDMKIENGVGVIRIAG
jgi:poly-gamma-glutamate capsule biosynthesis protein CapA/YwtB (metallophosphatase superfamily)